MASREVNGSESSSNSTMDIPSGAHFHGSSDFILNSASDSTEYVSKRSKSCGQTCRDIFRVKTLLKRLPILTWLPRYTLEQGIGDFIAGLTVGMTVIPQGLAYAGVAGLPSQVWCSRLKYLSKIIYSNLVRFIWILYGLFYVRDLRFTSVHHNWFNSCGISSSFPNSSWSLAAGSASHVYHWIFGAVDGDFPTFIFS